MQDTNDDLEIRLGSEEGDVDIQSTVRLHTGRAMPVLGLGTWQLTDDTPAIAKALALGYRMIDTSGDYGTQPGLYFVGLHFLTAITSETIPGVKKDAKRITKELAARAPITAPAPAAPSSYKLHST